MDNMLWITFIKDPLPWKKDSDNDFFALLPSSKLLLAAIIYSLCKSSTNLSDDPRRELMRSLQDECDRSSDSGMFIRTAGCTLFITPPQAKYIKIWSKFHKIQSIIS